MDFLEAPEPLGKAPLAYENAAFLSSPDGRIMRILSEYAEPLARFRRERVQDTIVFFGSARFHALDVACSHLELLENTGSSKAAPEQEQPKAAPDATPLQRSRAEAAVEMAHYYEAARKLAYMLTKWSMGLSSQPDAEAAAQHDGRGGHRHRFVVTSGGGPGIMEAANRGAHEAGGKTIGLNISLPFEQMPNPYITPELNFEFHYFFMRKYWFAYMAKALVVFPGGFGTLDEMFELLTLVQTRKLAKRIAIVMYGSSYWKTVLNLDVLVEKGAIAPDDIHLFQFVDTPEEAFDQLTKSLIELHLGGVAPVSEYAKAAPARVSAEPQPAGVRAEDEGSLPNVQELLGPDLAKTRP